jgi:S1-C subfamily serine protease
MTATVEPLVRLGGSIRLPARRSDGCTVEMVFTQGSTRGHVSRAVTSEDGRLVSATVRSWPLNGEEPQMAADVREAIQIAEKGLAEASSR